MKWTDQQEVRDLFARFVDRKGQGIITVVAKHLNVSREHLSRWRSGKKRMHSNKVEGVVSYMQETGFIPYDKLPEPEANPEAYKTVTHYAAAELLSAVRVLLSDGIEQKKKVEILGNKLAFFEQNVWPLLSGGGKTQ